MTLIWPVLCPEWVGGPPITDFFSGGYIEISHFKVANKGLVVGNKGRKRYF